MVLPSTGLVYLDSSALVKLLLPEPESGTLITYLRERGPLSSESPRLVRGDSRDLGGGGRATTAQASLGVHRTSFTWPPGIVGGRARS